MKPLYRTRKGVLYHGNSENILDSKYFNKLRKKINLILTSPPFPLIKKKKYGNLKGNKYIEWLSNFGPIFKELLTKPKAQIQSYNQQHYILSAQQE